MTIAVENHSSDIAGGAGRTYLNGLSQAFHGISEGFRAARVYDALSNKSDAQLAQLGLTRADLPRAALAVIVRGTA